jgi:hypothetical protein
MKRRLIFSILSLLFSITASAQKTEPAGVHFETAFDEINGMLTGKNPLSFKRAVFLSENAYLDNRLSYSAFDFSIKASASYCQRMAQNLPLNHPKEKPLGVNYAIFQHITDTTKHISGKDTFDFLPFRYDFNDFSGQKSWESMFVTKLLRERTGNCRSLPYYYKLLADECGVEAFLALAPNHIYIKHRDVGQKKEGWQRRVYNIELTNGSFPMDGWLMASGYITLDAIRSGYYLDTLSQSQAVAMCLFDLGKAYERKFGKRDAFVSRCVERVLAIHPSNINALLLKTELLKDRYERTKQPADYEAVEKHCSTLVANGYREMPLDMYLNWLFEVRAKSDAFVNVKRQPKKFDTQKGNPYKNDTTMKIHMQTLTDGRYDEFPEFAETTYVGSAVYDVYKKRIIGFIKRDTVYREATLEPEVVSRWLSTDPVFHPYESPYTAFANNPVYFVDPDGKKVKVPWIIKNEDDEKKQRWGVKNDGRAFVLTAEQIKGLPTEIQSEYNEQGYHKEGLGTFMKLRDELKEITGVTLKVPVVGDDFLEAENIDLDFKGQLAQQEFIGFLTEEQTEFLEFSFYNDPNKRLATGGHNTATLNSYHIEEVKYENVNKLTFSYGTIMIHEFLHDFKNLDDPGQNESGIGGVEEHLNSIYRGPIGLSKRLEYHSDNETGKMKFEGGSVIFPKKDKK